MYAIECVRVRCLGLSALAHISTRPTQWQQAQWKGGVSTHDWITEERACALALRITHTPAYRVLEVRQAWSAAVAWQVEAEDHRTGERLLLLDESQFDRRLMMEAGQPNTGRITTAQVAPIVKRAAAHHS